VAPLTQGGRESCARCGFAVDLTGASERGAAKLRDLMNDHLADCPTRPSAQERRELKLAVRKARFLYGEAAAVEAAEDHLAKIGGGTSQ
jgi:hypothetical protein